MKRTPPDPFGISRARTRLGNEQRALANFAKWADGAPPEIRILAEKKTAELVGFRILTRRPFVRGPNHR